MQDYLDMFSALEAFQQVYWACAVVGTLIFVVQLVLTLFGMDSSDLDVDVDFDGDTMDLGGGMSLFSIKNFVNFIVGFGWAGVCLKDVVGSPVLLCVVAVAVGFAFVAMFFFIKKETKKLEHNGAARIGDCRGRVVDVYLRIPPKRTGRGKVQVSINGSVHEYDALTDGDEELKSGCKAEVVEIIDSSTVLAAIHK